MEALGALFMSAWQVLDAVKLPIPGVEVSVAQFWLGLTIAHIGYMVYRSFFVQGDDKE